MEEKTLKKLTCNLTNETFSIYQDYYDKKVKQYGSEELLQRYYIKNNIISLIKKGHSIEDISNLVGFNIDPNKTEYYNLLTAFHLNMSGIKQAKDSTTTFIETDKDVEGFINRWKEYNTTEQS